MGYPRHEKEAKCLEQRDCGEVAGKFTPSPFPPRLTEPHTSYNKLHPQAPTLLPTHTHTVRSPARKAKEEDPTPYPRLSA